MRIANRSAVLFSGFVLMLQCFSFAGTKSYRFGDEIISFEIVTNEAFVLPKKDAATGDAVIETVRRQRPFSRIRPDRWATLLERLDEDVKPSMTLPDGGIAPRLPGVSKNTLDALPRSSAVIASVREIYRYAGLRIIPLSTVALQLRDTSDDALKAVEAALDARIIRAPGEDGTAYFQPLSADADLFAIASKANALTNVLWAEPNLAVEGFCDIATPNDPHFANQWTLGDVSPGLGLVSVWSIHTNRGTILTAVLDNGVEMAHPDLNENLVTGFDIVDGDRDASPDFGDAHGTACAGLIGAVLQNNLGVAGIAPNAKILPIRISRGRFWSFENAAAGITAAVTNGARILSISWGGPPNRQVANAIAAALDAGCLVFASAGNNGGSVLSPARLPSVIPVGAVTREGKRWPYSSFGKEMTNGLVAPSGDKDWRGDIWSTDVTAGGGVNTGGLTGDETTGDYTSRFGGTSAAAPLAAGVATLLWSAFPDLSANDVKAALLDTAVKVDKIGGAWLNGKSSFYGAGLISPAQAFEKALEIQNLRTSSLSPPPFIEVSANPSEFSLVPDTNLITIIAPKSIPEVGDFLRKAMLANAITELPRQTPSQPEMYLIKSVGAHQTQNLLREVHKMGGRTNTVFRSADQIIVPTGTISAELAPNQHPTTVLQAIGTNNLEVISSSGTKVRFKLLPSTVFTNVFEAAGALKNSGRVYFAEPDLLIESLQ